MRKDRRSSRPLAGITSQGSDVRPLVDGLKKQVALFVECPLADLSSTHRFVERSGRAIGVQDADVEP